MADTPKLAVRIRTALFEIAMSEPTEGSRITLWTVVTLILLLFIWALVAKLDIVAVAEGRLVPQTYVKIVQPSEAGIVREILVREGDEVVEGQVLARLDATENSADRVATARELEIQRLQIRRVDAELQGVAFRGQEGDDPQLLAQARAQHAAHRQQFLDSLAQEAAVRERSSNELSAATEIMRKLEKTLPSYRRTADAYNELAERQLVGALEAEERRREALERSQDLQSQRATVASLKAAVAQSNQRLAELKSAYESDLHIARLDATNKVTQLEQEAEKLRFRQARLDLRAPQAGLVKELATTTVGAVVQPGTVLVTLVPVGEPLLAEVSIQNEDIGFVHAGQHVRMKLATYPFQKYGMVDGIVKTVIADSRDSRGGQGSEAAQSNEDADAARSSLFSFKAIVELQEQQFKSPEAVLPLAAGMQLSAEIIEGRRTVMEYLLSPVRRISNEAARER